MYKRKTKDAYYIYGNCGYGCDIECNAEDSTDARRLLKEYRSNVNYPVKIVKRREYINN